MNLNENVLLSPELMEKARCRNLNMNIDQNKADVYSIGNFIKFFLFLLLPIIVKKFTLN